MASISARDGAVQWHLQLPFSESVMRIAPTGDGGAWASTPLHVYALTPQQGFVLPIQITWRTVSGTHLQWTWTWTGATRPESYIVVVYHYSGTTAIGDQQAQLPGTATSFTATGQCGRTYYLRIRAVGKGYPATYYAPPDGIGVTC